eukprot:snap_masked-scaffold_20-processed-gene-5.74-mRNA-1 protein AED:0.21 eAED:0.26 QI:0/-1/0/1/-1/1/1/0/394
MESKTDSVSESSDEEDLDYSDADITEKPSDQVSPSSLKIKEVENEEHDAEVDVIGSGDESLETNETRSPSLSPTAAEPVRRKIPVSGKPLKEISESSHGRESSFPKSSFPGSNMNLLLGEEKSSDGIGEISDKINKLHRDEVEGESGYTRRSSFQEKLGRAQISKEVEDCFAYIQRYKPHDIELRTKLIYFIPDYIPATGNIDSFIKPVPPVLSKFGVKLDLNKLGLTVLDEPCLEQSDPTLLELQLNSMSKTSRKRQNILHVSSIENPLRNKHKIMDWINSVKEVKRSETSMEEGLHVSSNLVEKLMRQWPEEIDKGLKTGELSLPDHDIDVGLKDWVKFSLSVLGIPFEEDIDDENSEKTLINGLYTMFSAYLAFKRNQHFHNIHSGKGNPY